MHHFCSEIQWQYFWDQINLSQIKSSIHHHIQRRTFQLFSLSIPRWLPEDHLGPQPPGPAGVGLSILISTILGEILRVNQSFSRHQVFRIPWTTQLVHTGSNQVSGMALAQLSQFIFHCGNFSPTVQFSRCPELYWPNSDNTAG
ncbi:hypothetical protein O181_070667 [Austropuccinia psidii MF-1]|uniref:Uncharacterized protein n=1 Tax=Austropuccinia psidii MF-1 TaxID=1389203 RepID=A0A9Q3I8H9_9BASI|nr:hypothetical protein [Austropuccinia psidii MF-1]